MKVAVVNNAVPFVRGGAEVLASALVAELERHGHVADLVRLPFAWDPVERIYDSMLAASLVRIVNVDRVIALKFPAYLVPHDHKVIWLLHQFRQFYDLWGSPLGGYEASPRVEEVRSLVQEADLRAFSETPAIFTNSAVVSQRLRAFNGISSRVLHPPLANPEAFHRQKTGDYLFAGGRINAGKRQYLVAEAMRWTKSKVRLVIAGPPDSQHDLDRLEAARRESGAADRITIIPRMITEEEKAALVNESLACVYCPYDEDSYGYVTLEAAQASKALVTTADSGGVTDLVIDGSTGFVREADPRQLAEAFDTLGRSSRLAEMLGDGARKRVDELGLSWDHVIETLLA